MAAIFVSLEGLHGVGKSTIARLLAQKLSAQLVATVPEEFAPLRSQLETCKNVDARMVFYLAAMTASGNKIQMMLDKGQSVVSDSFLYRTMAFHLGMGATLHIEPSKLITPIPYFPVLLTCWEDARQRRLIKRRRQPSFWGQLAEKHAQRILHLYRQWKLKEIDTTNLSPSEVADLIVAFVEGSDGFSEFMGCNENILPGCA